MHENDMTKAAQATIRGVESAAWWRECRKVYNLALVIAGLGAFACLAFVVDRFSCQGVDCPHGERPEITIFTIALDGFGYLVAMAIANILYGLGPLSEKLLRPANASRWRRICFGLGLCFSVALPFVVPLIAAWQLSRRR